MLSRENYHGRLPYDVYKKRFEERSINLEQELQKRIPEGPKGKQPETIKDKVNQRTKEITEKAKQELKKKIQQHTGINPDGIQNAFNDAYGEPKTDDEKRQRQDIINGVILSRAVHPNIENLTPEEVDRARLTKASKIYYLNDDEGRATQDYLTENNLGTLDTELSNKNAIVIKRPNGNVEIAYRGSMFGSKPSLQDFVTDAKIVSGTEEGVSGILDKTTQYAQADEQFEAVKTKYGNVDHIVGYSKGGALALYLGNKNNVDTTTYNPLIGPRLARNSANTNANHTIIRTTEDPVSLGLAATSNINHDRWTVKAIKPLAKYQSLVPIKNIYDAHRYENFTEEGQRKTGPAEEEISVDKIQQLGGKLTQFTSLNDISNDIKAGKSFSEHMIRYHKAESVMTPNGPRLKGERISPSSLIAQKWKQLGGQFTEGEAKYMNKSWEGEKRIDQGLDRGYDVENRGHHLEEGDIKLPQMPKTDRVSDLMNPDLFDRLGESIMENRVEMNQRIKNLKNKEKRGEELTEEEENFLEYNEGQDDLVPRDQSSEFTFSEEPKTFVEGPLSELPASKKSVEQLQQEAEDIFGQMGDSEGPEELKGPKQGVENEKLNDNFKEYENQVKEGRESQAVLSKAEENDYLSKSSAEKDKIMENMQNDLVNAVDEHNKLMQPSEEFGLTSNARDGISDTARGFNPTNLALGYAMGKGASALFNVIPNYDKLDRRGQEVIEGAAGGVLTAGAQEALGGRAIAGRALASLVGTGSISAAGSLALAPEAVGGAAGYLVGEESSKLIDKGLQKLGANKTERAAGSDIGGGTLGGLASGLTAWGTAMAADAIFGTELGTVFGPEGSLIGAGIGAGIGTLAFAGGEVKDLAKEGWNAFKSLF